MSKWQDISTAPKDGAQILLGRIDDWVETGGWYQVRDMWIGSSTDEYALDVWGTGELNPTHWKPLDTPPTSKGGE